MLFRSPNEMLAILTSLSEALNSPTHLPPGPAREVIEKARTAARKVNREGFRPAERATAAGIAALRSGLVAVIHVRDELQRLAEALESVDLQSEARADRDLFLSGLRALYEREAKP